MNNQPQPAPISDEGLENNLLHYFKKAYDSGSIGVPDMNAVARRLTDSSMQLIRQDREAMEKQLIVLKADIAYAIGKFEGLRYPSEYLERRYPEFKQCVDLDAQDRRIAAMKGEEK